MARSFNGLNQQISTLSVAGNPSSATLSCWVNPTGLANAYGAAMWMATGTNTFASIYVKSNGKLAMYYNNSVASYDGNGTFTLSIGTWYHLLFLGPNGVAVTGYVNGNLDGTGNANFSNSSAFSGQLQVANDLSNLLNAVVADAALWNIALSAGEISALARGVRPCLVRPSSLVLWWPLDGIQSPEPDLSGNAYSGIIGGSPPLANGPPVTLFTPKPPTVPPSIIPTVIAAQVIQSQDYIFSRSVRAVRY